MPGCTDVEQARLALASDISLGLNVATFDNLVQLLWERFGDSRTICRAGYRELALESLGRAGGFPKSLPRFAAAVIADLCCQTGVGWRDSARWGSVGQGSAKNATAFSGNAQALAGLVRSYADGLGKNALIEVAEAAHLLAIDMLLPADACVAVHGFLELSPDRLVLLRALACRADVLITLTWEAGHLATQAASPIINELDLHETFINMQNMVFRNSNDHPQGEPSDQSQGFTWELIALEEHLFADPITLPPAALPKSSAIRFSLADGVDLEACAVAAEVAAALADKAAGADSPKEIAIIYRNLPAHRVALEGALKGIGVEARFHCRVGIRETALGDAVLSALSFCLELDRANLLALVCSPFSGIFPTGAQHVERELRKYERPGTERMLGILEKEAPVLGERLVAVISGVSKGHRALAREDILAISALVGYLFSQGFLRGTAQVHALEDAAVYRKIEELLASASEAMATALCLQDIVDGISGLQVVLPGLGNTNAVQVMDAQGMQDRYFDTVIIGGLNAGEFPATPSEALFPGSLADQVLRAFGGTGHQQKDIEFERALFYRAATRARKRLVLSACARDDEGEPTEASAFYTMVAGLFDDDGGMATAYMSCEDEITVDRRVTFLDAPTLDAPDVRARLRAQAMDPQATSGRVEAARGRLRVRRGGKDIPDLRAEASEVSGGDSGNGGGSGSGTDAGAGAGVGVGVGTDAGTDAGHVVSPSQLEAYLACPYRWFYEDVLRPQQLDERFDARREGNRAHHLLSGTYKRLIAEGSLPLAPGSQALALQVLGEVEAELAAREPAERFNPTETYLGSTAAKDWATRILVEDGSQPSQYRPAYIEWEFGRREDPLDLGGGLLLVGRVDRIDIDDRGQAVAIDYKRSGEGSEFGINNMLGTGRIQLLLYLAAVKQGLGLESVAGFYRGLKTPFFRGVSARGAGVFGCALTQGDEVTAEGLDWHISGAIELGRKAAEGMRAGRISPAPINEKACKYCSACDACPYGRYGGAV
ncbi:MAG: PD-(D/E)XK nuclease family protein [Coriobacteriia bacterium]|nr:PD-(D/E)XK nuclease family protein [Coriobacteriia bacterium]